MLRVRVMKQSERKRFSASEGTYHYLGETRSGGDTLRLIFEEEGEWVALMVWGSACYRLKNRDMHIGWTPRLRAERQKLVVSNRRFTLLSARGTRPNLASQVLGLAVRELPALWRKAHGYEPLLAETFCDMEVSSGTCYRAAGWTPLGLTKGFSRHQRDFYVPNGKPKTLWVKALRPKAEQTLCGLTLPPECTGGAHCDGWGVTPIPGAQIESLHEMFCRVPDPRKRNRQFHIGAMLSILAMAVMSGARNISQVVRFSQTLTLKQRKVLGLPRFKSDSDYRKNPSYNAFYNLLRQLDVTAFAHVMSEWLQAHEGTLPRQLALDGKFISDVVGIVSLVNVETGVPVAVAPASQKEGEGNRCEMRVGRHLLAKSNLEKALVSADALHAQSETVREIAMSGGESLTQIKGNQQTILASARQLAAKASPLLP